jgi:hypothetical protein
MAPRELHFPDGRCATVVDAEQGCNPAAILAALGLRSPRPVIAIVGGARQLDGVADRRLAQLFSRGIARVAAESSSVIVDGGTQAGVMSLIGQGVADRGRRSQLLGVAPGRLVTYPGGPAHGSIQDGAALEPNHTHFVLVRADRWGDAIDTADGLMRELAGDRPGVAVLAGGGPIAADEVLLSVRRNWTVVILAGTGGFADHLATALHNDARDGQWEHAGLGEILVEGRLDVFPASGTPEGLARKLAHYLRPPASDPPAQAAWQQFAWLDLNAAAERRTFERLQKAILGFGVLATLVAILHTVLGPGETVANVLRVLLVLLTLGVTVLSGVVTRFKVDTRWVLLRGGAEAIKGEIYRYRAGVSPYNAVPPEDAGKRLADEVKKIASRIFATEVAELGLRTYTGKIPPAMYGAESKDTGLGPLAPDDYVSMRIDDQIRYYRRRTAQLDRKLRLTQWATLGFGGLATLLAAFSAQVWVPLATAAATALTAYVEYQQVGPTLAKYNQALASLVGIQTWWATLSASERAEPRNKEDLVGSTEEILAAELTGWVRQMQDALDKRRAAARPNASD